MPNEQILFVADTAFIDSTITQKYKFLSVFPRERDDGAYRANLDELLQRSKFESGYLNDLLPKLTPVFKKYMPAAKNETENFIRPILFIITSLFADRCIRVLHRIQQQDENVSVVKVEPLGSFQWPTEIIQTWHLNQEIIQRIMLALSFKEATIFDRKSYPEYPNEHSQKNLIFFPQQPGLSGALSKLLNRFFGLLERIPNRTGKYKSMGFTMDRYYLAKRGLLGPFSPFQSILRVELAPLEKNVDLRENLLMETEEIVRPQFELFFSQIEKHLQSNKLSQLSQAYARLFIDWFPVGFLEGLSFNLQKTSQSFKASNFPDLIGHSLTSNEGYLAGAVTRMAGKTVFGVQHGGHNGYIDDNSAHGTEYAHYDKMITWGWTKIDDHLPHCETIPLPSPKLSEQTLKSNYLEKIKSTKPDIRDILFLSNLFHRFPNPSTCGQSRVDFIDEISNSQEDLMRSINDAGLTISHKPFSMKYVDLYPEHYRRLEMAGGASYHLLNSTHKGLTVKLINTCRIVLYDQIGTGTLECLTSEVPSMVFWKRIYSRESSCAKDLVAALEQYGVVHSNTDTLMQEIKTYLAAPDKWMNNTGRKQAIQNFCQKFALTDPHWHQKWKEFLSNIPMQ
jgi:hypothetical protein